MGESVESRVIACGYGRPALDALRALVSEAKRVDRLAPVTIVVPNNIAGIVARRHLAHGLEGQGAGVAGLHLTTLPRLAEQVAATTLHPRLPATQPVVAAAWRAALDADPGKFNKVKDHPATLRALTSAHRELRDLTRAGRDATRFSTPLSADLLRLHEQVNGSLMPEWYDATALLEAATAVAAAHPERLAEQGDIVLYLPQPLRRAQADFAKALHTSFGLTAIVALTGVHRADGAVRRTLDRIGLPAPGAGAKPPVATTVLHASDSDDEVRCVVRDLVGSLASTPAHRTAVLYGSAQPYARLLHEHLTASGLTVNGPATRAVRERAIARGLLGVLELAGSELPRAATFTALAEAAVRTFDGAGVPVARWERTSRLAGVVGGQLHDWTAKLDLHVERQQRILEALRASDDPWQSRINAAQREIDTALALRGFVTTLGGRLEEGRGATTWARLSAWALDLFHDLYGKPEDLTKLPAEEQYAAVTVEQSLRGLASLDAFETTADLQQLIEVLGLELESALPRVGRYGEGVFVGPISASVGLDLDKVFVVGLAEDGYPGRLRQDALLNDKLRAASNGELEQPRDRLDTQHRNLLAALACAPDVVASFPRGDLRRSTERLPSRFLLPTLRDIAGDQQLAATGWDTIQPGDSDRLISSSSFATTLRSTAAPASEQEWRVRASSAGVLDDAAVDAAHQLQGARGSEAFTRFDGNLRAAEGLPDYAREQRLISPTALESYASCPHRYFMQRLLRVEPLEHPEEIIQISPMDIGNLIHESMDALISEAEEAGTLPSYGEPWTSQHRGRLQEIATRKAEEFAAHGLTGHPRLWEPEKGRILVELDRMLSDDDAWRAGRDAEVIGSELAFGKDGRPPVVVRLSDGEVRMVGSADKVDRTRDGVLLVTDIKSGKADKFKALEQDPVAAGTKLQLPVYAYAARQAHGGDDVEAMYWFVLREAGRRIPLALTPELEQTYAETLGVLVQGIAHGLFLGKPSEQAGFRYVDCEYCTPDGIGHAEARAGYLAKRSDPLLESLIRLIDPTAYADADPDEVAP